MSIPTIPPSVIAQRGKKITLIDGTIVTCVYTFSSLMRIEEDFGSVNGALAVVGQGSNGTAFTSVAQILAAGLEHEQTSDGQKLDDLDTLRSLLDPMKFNTYSDAVGAAIEAAFPDAGESDGEGDTDPSKDSPGESGTTSRPSSSGEATSSSGA